MKLYSFLSIISIFITSTLLDSEFLSTGYFMRIGLILLLIIASVILLIRDIKRKGWGGFNTAVGVTGIAVTYICGAALFCYELGKHSFIS